MITEQTSKFRKTVETMLAAGTLASSAALGLTEDIQKTLRFILLEI